MTRHIDMGPATDAEKATLAEIATEARGRVHEYLSRMGHQYIASHDALTVQQWRMVTANMGDTLQRLETIVARSAPSTLVKQQMAEILASRVYDPIMREVMHSGSDILLAWHIWQLIGLARWACSGFPVVLVPPSVAANLIATAGTVAPASEESELKAPWRSFMIAFGDGTGSMFDKVSVVLVNSTSMPTDQPKRAGVQIWANERDEGNPAGAADLFVSNYTLNEMVGMTETSIARKPSDGPLNPDTTPEEDRIQSCCCKLAAGVCIALTAENAVVRKKSASGPKKVKHSELSGGTYVLGLPIKCDLTKEVSDWVRGVTKSITRSAVRWLVRGHWRQQACGSEMRDHRRTWIAPYWKGTERASILVRAHELGNQTDGAN